jgi:hypothetical protein
MIIGYQGRIETHQTLGIIITVITLEEIRRHEGIKKNPQSNQILNSSKLGTVCFNSSKLGTVCLNSSKLGTVCLNSSKLGTVCFNSRNKLAALHNSLWYIYPSN